MRLPLHITVSGASQQTFADVDRVVVGRDPTCAVVVRDTGVSREHCRFELSDGQWTVVDTSLNGTFAGAERIRTRVLSGTAPTVFRLGHQDTGSAVTAWLGTDDVVVEDEPTAIAPV